MLGSVTSCWGGGHVFISIPTSMQAGIQSLQIRASGVGTRAKSSHHHREIVTSFPIESKAIYLSISRRSSFLGANMLALQNRTKTKQTDANPAKGRVSHRRRLPEELIPTPNVRRWTRPPCTPTVCSLLTHARARGQALQLWGSILAERHGQAQMERMYEHR